VPWTPCFGPQSADRRFYLQKSIHGWREQLKPHLRRYAVKDQDPNEQPPTNGDILPRNRPREADVPLGAIHLDIIFDTPANFRKEKIEFEVVDWPSQYHAILG
jgi:hypothetical protein